MAQFAIKPFRPLGFQYNLLLDTLPSFLLLSGYYVLAFSWLALVLLFAILHRLLTLCNLFFFPSSPQGRVVPQ